jgi:NSS family neurotransmitter:Na+ symporter
MAIAMTYASYLPEGSKLVDNAIIVAFSNSGFEVFNSIGIFSILGFMTLTSGIPFNELVTSGTGLAFVVFPQVFNTMGFAAYIIGPLFFLCILFAGITSVIALLEGVCYSISEKFLIERKKTATVVCIVGFFISTIFATGAGSTILGIFDGYLNNFALLFAVLLECLIFGWIYKFDYLIETLNQNSTIQVGKTWKTVIKYILPICIAGLWIQGIMSTVSEADGLSRTIMLILTIILIVVPIIFAKLPAINKDYYNV